MVPMTLKSRWIDLWGKKVKDYSIMSDYEGTPTWKWKYLRGLDFDKVLINQFKKILEGRKPLQPNKRDTLIWPIANNGK